MSRMSRPLSRSFALVTTLALVGLAANATDVEQITRILTRMVLAALLGGVQGLTTAAGVWMTAAIGVACGLGRESTALLSTILTLIILAGVPRLLGRDDR